MDRDRDNAARSPVIAVVATLDEARQAADAARRATRPLLLVTAPGACAGLGPGYLLEMVRQAGADGRLVRALIDCGPDAGYAMLALRLGWREVHVTGEPSAVAGIEDMTLASGGVFHRELPGDRTGNGRRDARHADQGSGLRRRRDRRD